MFGLQPTHNYHLLFLLVPLIAWLTTRTIAKRQSITILHNSSLAVSYWEELIFRSLVYGLTLTVINNAVIAIVISAALFGVFHLRNLWWSSRKQVLVNCLYAGLLFGPVVGLLRWWTGDIYLGIAIHAFHNFMIISLPTKAPKPTNKFLLSKQNNMNWFEYLFSGFWLMSK